MMQNIGPHSRIGPFDATLSQMASTATGLESFNHDIGRYPTTTEGLAALLTQPNGLAHWQGPYINKTPTDQWGHPFHYSLNFEVRYPDIGGDHIDTAQLRTTIEKFKFDTGRYPTADEGLSALISQPPDLPGWKGPYLQKIPADKWGHPINYTPTFHLQSPGPDGIEGTPDDLTKDSK